MHALSRSSYQLSKEAFTAVLGHELGIAPLAFAALTGSGYHAQHQGVHCTCEKSARIDVHSWHHVSCSIINKKRHNHHRGELAQCCTPYEVSLAKRLMALLRLIHVLLLILLTLVKVNTLVMS